jgi:hypothetical protein
LGRPRLPVAAYHPGRPIPIHFASIADFTSILVIVIIIFVRFCASTRPGAGLSELAAARSVQELMIPMKA